MAQYSKLFKREMLCDKSTETQLNLFLTERPNYKVSKVSFENPRGTCVEHLFVVFEIADAVPKSEDKSERLRELLTLAKTDMLYLLLELKATGEKFNAEKLLPALFVLRNEYGLSVEKVNTDFATICDYLEEDAE